MPAYECLVTHQMSDRRKKSGTGTPAQLKGVLGDVVARFGLDRSLDDYRIWQAWDEVVGPVISRNAQPQKLNASRLVVAVRNAGWMQELTLLRRDLAERLNRWMGREVIKEIFLVVGKVDTKRTEHRRLRPRVEIEPTTEPRPKSVTKQELEDAIARLWKMGGAETDAGDKN
jgi:hypothetical protein